MNVGGISAALISRRSAPPAEPPPPRALLALATAQSVTVAGVARGSEGRWQSAPNTTGQLQWLERLGTDSSAVESRLMPLGLGGDAQVGGSAHPGSFPPRPGRIQRKMPDDEFSNPQMLGQHAGSCIRESELGVHGERGGAC
eukprot:15481778-Alexandrium_andersonii.AAC.1